MSEIRTNLTISGESSEYRSNLQISVVTLNSNLVDTQSSFRTNLNIVSSLDGKTTTTLNTTLKLENTALDFYLVDMTKMNQSMLYFSKFFNMNFEPEVIWEFLAKGTNEQINISHLSNALSVFSTKAELAQISSIINTVGTSINQHILNSNIHLTQEEKTFISEIMNKPPWGSNDNRSGLFEYVNVGNASNVIWAARPIKYENKDVGIISNTFISCKGVDVTAGSGGGGITRADLFVILSGEPIDTNEYINAKYLRLDENLKDYAKRDWVELTFIKEETDPTVPVYVKNITEKQILSWDLVASLFKLSADGSYIITNENRGFVSTSFISCKGVDISAQESGSGIDMSLIWYYLGQEGVDQINKSHLIEALEDYATIDWVNNQGYLKSFVEQDPTVPNHVKLITADEITNWNLVSSIFSLSKDSSYVLVENNRGLVSNSFISCKGLDISAPQVGGTFDRSSLFNILSGEPQNGESINLGYLDLSTYATIEFVVSQGYVTSGALTGYATQQWVLSKGYATTSDLDTRINNLINGAPEAYDTLKEIADVLAGNVDSIGDIITALGNKADKATTLAGYGITDALSSTTKYALGDAVGGNAVNANKFGNQLPTYYATADGLTGVSNRVKTLEDVIGIDANGDVYIKGTRNFYTEGGTIGMAGLGSGGGTGGGGTAGLGAVTVRVNGQDYTTNVSGIVTIPDYPSLGGYATQSWVGDNYLSKSGGTISKSSYVPLVIQNTASDLSTILFKGVSGDLGYLGFNGASNPVYMAPSGYAYALIHTGNLVDTIDKRYLSIAGGDIYSESHSPLRLKTTNTQNRLEFVIDNTAKALVGYHPTYGAWLYNSNSNGYIGIKDDGTPHYQGNTLYHSGNFNPANYLPLSGGTLEGALQIGTNANTSYNYLRLVRSTHYAQINNTGAAAIFSFGDYTSGATTQEKAISIGDSGINYIVDNSKTYPILHSNNYADYALPLSGGTIKGAGSGILTINRTSGNPLITFQANGSNAGFLGFNTLGNPIYVDATTYADYPLLHSGNYSSYALPLSGGKTITGNFTLADGVNILNSKGYGIFVYDATNTVLGIGTVGAKTKIRSNDSALIHERNGTDYAILDQSNALTLLTNGNTLYHSGNFNPANYLPLSGGTMTGAIKIGGYTSFGVSDGIFYLGNPSYPVYVRSSGIVNINGNAVIHAGNIGSYNAGSATKLQTARTIWGQSFDGTGNVSGILLLNNGIPIQSKDSSGANRDIVYMTAANHLVFGTGAHFAGGDTYIGGNALHLRYGTTPTVGLTLKNSGNVLVGAAEDNGAKLQVEGSASFVSNRVIIPANGDRITFNAASGYSMGILAMNSGNTYIEAPLASNSSSAAQTPILIGWRNGVYPFYIAPSGNILMGTTADSGDKLRINGAVRANGHIRLDRYHGASEYLQLEAEDVNINYRAYDTDGWCSHNFFSNDYKLVMFNGYAKSVEINGNLTATGGATFGGDVYSEGTMAMAKLASSSDRKLKENIKWLSADKSMEVVRALRPTEWNWKKDNTHSFGFIAQDVQPIVPEMVSSVNDTLRLEYNQLHAFEIGAIQHIDNEVEQLKRDLKTANNKIEVLENQLNEYRRNAQWQ